MKITTIKQHHDCGIWLQLTAELNNGRVVVEMRPDDAFSDGTILTAREARTLARHLVRYANAADRGNGKAQP